MWHQNLWPMHLVAFVRANIGGGGNQEYRFGLLSVGYL
jgi:hypothetical protein